MRACSQRSSARSPSRPPSPPRAARRTNATESRRASASPARGSSCRRRAGAAYLLTCPAAGASSAGSTAQVTSRVSASASRDARSAGAAGRDDDAVRALPRGLRLRARPGVQPRSAASRAVRRRALDRVGVVSPPDSRSSTARTSRSLARIGGFAKVACQGRERLVGSWHALALPDEATASAFERRPRGRDRRPSSATGRGERNCERRASIDAHAIVQPAAECAP